MAADATTVLPVGNDDALTVCVISLTSAMLADVRQDGLTPTYSRLPLTGVKRVIFDRVLGSRGADTLCSKRDRSNDA